MWQIEFKRGMLITLFVLWCVLFLSAGVRLAEGQERSSATSASTSEGKDIDLEIKLYLLVASNAAGEAAKPPPAQLETALRQLSPSLPFNNYRWAGTFINRVAVGGSSNIRGLAGPLLGTTPPTSGTPSFYDMAVNKVSLGTGAGGREQVRFSLHFGSRVPIVVAGSGANAAPTVSYEITGISTSVNIRENEPVVVGTMSMPSPNDMLVLVVLVKSLP